MPDRRHPATLVVHDGLEFCGTCGAALGVGHRGHPMYGAYVGYKEFERVLLASPPSMTAAHRSRTRRERVE
jgi:hypothetical protein